MSPARQMERATTQGVSGAPLIGTWNNVDKSTKDLVRLVITAQPTGVSVNPFGACTPSPCNWGVEPATLYASSVDAGLAVAFTALFNLGFANVIVTGNLRQNELLVKTFTKFTDASGRSSYYTAATMMK
jgi:hypothetical protein